MELKKFFMEKVLKKDFADMDIAYRDDVLSYLSLPSIPKRLWDGVSSFSRGVCVLRMIDGGYSYGVCSYDSECDSSIRVTKVFSFVPFDRIEDVVYVVPEYMAMDEDILSMDLDDASRVRVGEILADARELEGNGVEDIEGSIAELPEWVFDEIHTREEAVAWLKQYNASHRIKGAVPTKEDTLKLRLLSIYSEMKSNNQ